MNVMYGLAAAALALGGLLCLLAGLVRRVRQPSRRFCPGKAGRLRRVMWLVQPWRSVCGYDLSDRREVRITCPECGGRVTRHGLVRASGRVQWTQSGVAAFVLAAMMFGRWDADHRWEWVRALPTTPLLMLDAAFLGNAPLPVQTEVANRVYTRRMTARQREIYAAALVRDLASDGVRGNADRAGWLLTQLEREGVEALLGALRSQDYQQRQMAADSLRSIEGYELCRDLIRVTIEGLRDDRFPFDPGSALDSPTWTWCSNARSGTAFLIKFARLAQPELATGLTSDDRQQRLLCAAIAGWGHLDELAPDAGPILLEHLADNDMAGDAKIAFAAMAGFGEFARGTLESAIDSPDMQQRQSVRALLGRLGDPRFRGQKPPRLSGNGIDPATLDPGDATRDLE